MSFHQELEYGPEIQRITGVQFSIMSPDEIRRRSVAEIYTNETSDGDVPKVGGLFDPRMGVLDHGKKCPTDELDNRHCPGYFGHIELGKKVFYMHFMKYTIKTLHNVCWKCSKLLISPKKDVELQKIVQSTKGVNRFLAVTELCSKVRMCGVRNEDGCGTPQPTVIKSEPNSIGKLCAEWSADDVGTLDAGDESSGEMKQISSATKSTYNQLIWDADDVDRIFRRITDDEVEVLGMNPKYCRPEWLICSVLSVPPPSVRPSVRADNNTRMEDDLTHKLCDIIKTNKTLKQKIASNAQKNVIDEWYKLLQFHVATLVNNNLPGIPQAQQRSGRPLKAIMNRLNGKEGRVRNNLMGKRVDHSARSVITPDARLKLNQLGVPYDICINLTFPEKVNAYNKERLLGYVRNGYYKYPGAKSIKRRATGKIISLSVLDTSTLELYDGDIVNRHLIEGDIVLFNRQPSLHKMSMMQHSVVPLPYKTFRLNVSVTRPYNADKLRCSQQGTLKA
jgi:DNA-directed RNA polymerase II subunit RPB1